MNLKKFNKAFENKARLGIMAMLIANEEVSFTEFKDLLDLTDGNLSSHLKALEKEHYLEVKKEFVDRKPKSTYLVTESGKAAFQLHIEQLEALIKMNK
ncbi:winged helix-turn-helix domain-containing protein [Lacihabitans lacunae]|jgi:DNA-binding MarR family transcriptional regulator|uniref:Winged helix-turn-helix domain-containing protein n=1 Tax=Lacihabitans lacunae TaxID=1028214 RepID=A0ABV7YVF5_9BACT